MVEAAPFDVLLKEAKRGALASWFSLLQGHVPELARLARRELRRRALFVDEPDDLVQDTLLQAVATRKQFRGTCDSQLRFWLCRILVRRLRAQQRRERRWKNAECLAEIPASGASRRGDEEKLAALRRSLDALSADDRALLHLRYWDERSLAEIAALQEKSPEAVNMKLSRARRRLCPDGGA